MEDTVGRTDQTVTCRDCGKQFIFTAGEQEYYESRGLSSPTRCHSCRAARKAERGESSSFASSRGYDREPERGGLGRRGGPGGGQSYDRGGERSDFGRSSRGEARGPRTMYKVRCAACGIETEVPFEPRTGKPVYCRDCYEKQRGGR